jgi:hypothetical protein
MKMWSLSILKNSKNQTLNNFIIKGQMLIPVLDEFPINKLKA